MTTAAVPSFCGYLCVCVCQPRKARIWKAPTFACRRVPLSLVCRKIERQPSLLHLTVCLFVCHLNFGIEEFSSSLKWYLSILWTFIHSGSMPYCFTSHNHWSYHHFPSYFLLLLIINSPFLCGYACYGLSCACKLSFISETYSVLGTVYFDIRITRQYKSQLLFPSVCDCLSIFVCLFISFSLFPKR